VSGILQRPGQNLAPGAFASVMATGIVSTAAARYRLEWVSIALVVAAGLIYAGLLVAAATRAGELARSDLSAWDEPRSAFGLLTFVAGSTVLGERLDELGLAIPGVALVLIGIVSWAVLSYGVQLRVMLRVAKPSPLRTLDGSWLLWVVATQSLATAAAMVAVHEAPLRQVASVFSVCAWAAGAVLYLILITMIFARLLLFDVAPADLEPGYWIAMGATAITVLAGARILNLPHAIPVVGQSAGTVAGFSLMLWAFGTWMLPFLVAIGLWRHVAHRVPFGYEVGLWSMVFPLGMYATASAEFGGAARLPFMVAVGAVAAYVAIAAWAVVAVLRIMSLRRSTSPSPS
jgi:tellurite resistance protein TehA-like permease